jgi:enoyl-CoA hydratase/carnithine racemase
MTAGELMDRLEHARDELVDDPVVVVECAEQGSVDTVALERNVAGLPAVLIATNGATDSSVAAAMDLTAVDAAEIDRFEQAVTQHREAAVSLAMLLRDGPQRSVSEGLLAESATYSMLQAGADHRRWLAGRPDNAASGADGADVVQLRREGDQLHITLNRPDSRNAFNAVMRDALLEALAVIAADPSLTAILDANGRSFCSGGDLREFGTIDDPARAHLLRMRRSVGRAIDEVSDRVTVQVHGHCVGAGVELPSFAARVTADPDATFWLPEVSMGLIPGAGGTVSIPRRIGRQRALRLALSAEPIDAAAALEWGLVDRVSPRSPAELPAEQPIGACGNSAEWGGK